MSSYSMFEVIVSNIEPISSRIKRFTLVNKHPDPLPSFTGGSHIFVQMQIGGKLLSNAYSLLNSPFEQQHYQIAVQREADSKGGSDYLHDQVAIGDTLTISTPNNLFALSKDTSKHLLIAGGIGITPFMAQLHELHQWQHHYHLHYCVPSEQHNGFQQQLLQSSFADHVSCHTSSLGSRLDLESLLAATPPETHIYVCGPARLNQAVLQIATEQGFSPNQLHSEAFTTDDLNGGAFTLVLARSGVELQITEEMTILQALENSKAATVESLCREGICGTCETRIIEGEADHRDHYLTEEERQAQQTILVCCSRAKGQRLVLDL